MSNKPEFYNLNDNSQGIQRNLAPGLDARIFVGDQSMLSIVNFAPNSTGSLHSHPEEQWGVLLQGSGLRIQGGEELAVTEGDFWRTHGNVAHTFKAGNHGARVLDIFSPPTRGL